MNESEPGAQGKGRKQSFLRALGEVIIKGIGFVIQAIPEAFYETASAFIEVVAIEIATELLALFGIRRHGDAK